MLFTDELLPFKSKESFKLGYKLDIPQSYEYYKNKTRPGDPNNKTDQLQIHDNVKNNYMEEEKEIIE